MNITVVKMTYFHAGHLFSITIKADERHYFVFLDGNKQKDWIFDSAQDAVAAAMELIEIRCSDLKDPMGETNADAIQKR